MGRIAPEAASAVSASRTSWTSTRIGVRSSPFVSASCVRASSGRGRPRPEEARTHEAETNGEDRTPIRVLVQDVREALTALAASGAMRPTGMVAHVLRTRVRRAGDLQLATLAAALAEVGDRPSPGAVLRACAVVDRLDALTP